MAILLSYVLLGLSLEAPIGPVNAAQLDRGLKGESSGFGCFFGYQGLKVLIVGYSG